MNKIFAACIIVSILVINSCTRQYSKDDFIYHYNHKKNNLIVKVISHYDSLNVYVLKKDSTSEFKCSNLLYQRDTLDLLLQESMTKTSIAIRDVIKIETKNSTLGWWEGAILGGSIGYVTLPLIYMGIATVAKPELLSGEVLLFPLIVLAPVGGIIGAYYGGETGQEIMHKNVYNFSKQKIAIEQK